MTEPEAFLYGRFLPASQAAVSIADAGFVLGATATEQLRTFGGRIFRLDQHLDRLAHSLAVLGITPDPPLAEIGRVATDLAARNHALLEADDDLGVGIFVTPGPYATLAALAPPGPLVGIYTYPLPFQHWADAYERGQALRTTGVVQVPRKSWPRELKVRSRVHYYLADREAAAAEEGARAVLLDADGAVTEATTANLLVVLRDGGLCTPPRERVLPGITLSVVQELAAQEGVPLSERTLFPDQLAAAEEIMLCSTTACLLPIVRFNGHAVGSGRSGDVYRRLLAAFGRLAGVELAAQARRFAARG